MRRVSQVGKVVKARIARVRESMGLSFSELGIDRSPQLIQEGSKNFTCTLGLYPGRHRECL